MWKQQVVKKIDIVKHVTNYTEIKRWNQLKEDSIVLKMEYFDLNIY